MMGRTEKLLRDSESAALSRRERRQAERLAKKQQAKEQNSTVEAAKSRLAELSREEMEMLISVTLRGH